MNDDAGPVSRSSRRHSARSRWGPRLRLARTLIQIQHPTGLLLKRWVSSKEPVVVTPGTQCILGKPATQGTGMNALDDAFLFQDTSNIVQRVSAQRLFPFTRPFAGYRLGLGLLLRGKNPADALNEVDLSAHPPLLPLHAGLESPGASWSPSAR